MPRSHSSLPRLLVRRAIRWRIHSAASVTRVGCLPALTFAIAAGMDLESELSPRKRPTQPRAHETVDAIFEAAIQLLEKADADGKNASVQSIADRAGVSIGSLYQYFPSKESLVSALIGFHQRRAVASLEKDLEAARGLSGEEAATRLVTSLIDCKNVRQDFERRMIRYFCRVGDLSTLTAHDARMNAAVERFIRSLGDGVRPVDTGIAAFLITNVLRTAMILTIVQNPERLKDPVFKAELIRMVVNYMRA
jgi:AcrR family transcriptional regulator